MSTSRNGREREYRVRDHLTRHGWRLLMHAAGSKGSADLAMVHAEYGLALVQVGGKSKRLGPDARARLVADATDAGALALLAIPRHGVGIDYWHVDTDKPSHWQKWTP